MQGRRSSLVGSSKVTVGPSHQEDPEWPGWIWCDPAAGRGEWVPEALIQSNGATGKALGPFNARELDLEAGEALMASKTLNGWA